MRGLTGRQIPPRNSKFRRQQFHSNFLIISLECQEVVDRQAAGGAFCRAIAAGTSAR
jgi:hypothetical protein